MSIPIVKGSGKSSSLVEEMDSIARSAREAISPLVKTAASLDRIVTPAFQTSTAAILASTCPPEGSLRSFTPFQGLLRDTGLTSSGKGGAADEIQILRCRATSPQSAENAPVTNSENERVKKHLRFFRTVAIAIIAASVAFGIIGVATACYGIALLAVPAMICALALGYASYNGYRMFDNFLAILDKISLYRTADVEEVNIALVKKKLSEGTVLFQWATNPLADAMISDLNRC